MEKGENEQFLEKVFSGIKINSSVVEAKRIFKSGANPSKKMKASRGALEVSVYKINEDSTFLSIFSYFGDLKNLHLSRGQIAGFCNRNREKLSKKITFFLTKKGDNFLVVSVTKHGPGRPLNIKTCGRLFVSSENFVVIPKAKKTKKVKIEASY